METVEFLSGLKAEKDVVTTSLLNAKGLAPQSKAKHQALDICADLIILAIYQAMELSTPRRLNSGCGEPWWNKECQDAVVELQKAKKWQGANTAALIEDSNSDGILVDCKRKLRRVVKRAKKRHFQEIIDGLDSHNIFQAAKWPRSVRQYSTPPIRQADGTLAVSNLEKQATLRKELLSTVKPVANDIAINKQAPDLIQEKREAPIEWHNCSFEEVERAILQASNTAPGIDQIPPKIIRQAWPVYCVEITELFQLCLGEGYHPFAFKNVTLCALLKPGKRPRDLPQSYRLIALLSSLGKALEKIVARRLGQMALKYRIVSSLYFGAIAGRSAVDAATTLTHDVKKAFNEKYILTALAFDIKGAFDRVTEKRLIQRLYEQNVPLLLIRWVASFLADRSAAIRLDGHTENQEPIQIGVPQGSPVSPILFMLFTEPLFKILQGNNKKTGLKICGYVDDGLLTAKATDEANIVLQIQEAFRKVELWAHQNGMVFDPEKFEAIHFSRKKRFPNPDILLPDNPLPSASGEPRLVRPVSKTAAMRWLGVFFDARLSFKNHVTKLASKARVAAAGLRTLTNTVRGASPLVMRRAVHSCIIPILTYGAPAWWPDVTRANQKGNIVQNQIQGLGDKLDKVQNIALKVILPAWKTTPIKILQREAATPPIRHTIDYLCELASLRLHKLEP